MLSQPQLAWMGGVIDQIVYRLYGLGAEEIRVVEGVNGHMPRSAS